MKTCYFLFAFIITTFGSIAQKFDTEINTPTFELVNESAIILEFPKPSVKEETEFKFKAIKSAWYNYDDALAGITNQNYVSGTRIEYLFNDTGVYTTWSNGSFKNVSQAKVGVFLDPASPVFDNSTNTQYDISEYLNYGVDSIDFFFLYNRNLHDSIVDTLRFEVFSSQNLVQNGAIQIQYIVDPVHYQDTVWFYDLNTKVNNGIVGNLTTPSEIINIPLDTSSVGDTIKTGAFRGFNIVYLTPQNYNDIFNGHDIAVTANFIPGYSYNHGDTLNNMNYVRIPTGEQNVGTSNSFPYYFGEKDKNAAYFYPTSITPQIGSLTTIEFFSAFKLETMLSQPGGLATEWAPFDFKLSYDDSEIGFEEINTNVSELTAFPNPANDLINIAYNITESGKVMVNITNMLGEIIYSESSNNWLTSGKYVNQINVKYFPAGQYFYSVNGVTKPLVITK